MPADGPIAVIIQARMSSSRLPGKVMLPIQGKPLLEYQIERLRHAKRIDKIAVATCETSDCDVIAELCATLEIHATRGSEHDVLSRYAKCSREINAGLVVRITSDCPLIDPGLVDTGVDEYLSRNVDYLGLDIPESFPRGVDIEIFSAERLYEVDRDATTTVDREHVAPYLYTNPDRFKIERVRGPHRQGYRLCVDTKEDFELVTHIADHFPSGYVFDCTEVVALLDSEPEWARINADVVQKVDVEVD